MLLDGVPADELEPLLSRLERRAFAPGAVLIEEGDRPGQVLVTQSGTAEVLVADADGVRHAVGHVRPGATLGEMSLFTGEPASATVRAVTPVEALVLPAEDLDALAQRHPVVYRRLGELLSQRLARVSRLAVRRGLGRLTVLDAAATPEQAWALACSVAWHTRRPTLLAAAGGVPSVLEPFVGDGPGASAAALPDDAAHLTAALTDLRTRYDDVLVLGAPAGLAGVEAPLVLPAVPALAAADEAALRERLLPAATEAGRALGRVAREVGRLRVGVAFGAGSMRGYAHFGVLRALERLGLAPDVVAGTSVGASAAALYALGHDPDEGAALFDRSAPTLFRPTLPRRSLLSSRALRAFYRDVAGERRFEELDVPLAIVAADLLSGREVVLRRGPLWPALLASCAIPGIYPPQPVNGYLLVDGGIVSPVPVGAAAALGADVVLAVKLIGGAAEPDLDAEAVPSSGGNGSAVGSILRSIELMQARIGIEAGETTTVTIAPEFPSLRGAKLRRFAEGRRFVADGEAAFAEALPRLRVALPWLRD